MKKNAILIAGILCVASASRAQEQSLDRYESGQYDTAPGQSSAVYIIDDDISADSSKRGGSLDARGHDQDANNDEIEGVPHPINPGKQAESSVRGGSIYARDREWNHDSEPSSGHLDRKRHMKADSSIRGGSLEARGGREAVARDDKTRSAYRYNPDYTSSDSTQGSSATWTSDQAAGSLSGSPNWNPSDDLLRDGLDVEAQSNATFEPNNDASVEGAAKVQSESATLDDVELDYEASTAKQPSDSSSLKRDLNSSAQVEKNISGEFDIKTEQSPNLSSSELKIETTDPNSLNTDSDLESDIERENREAVGAAATSESGSSSSSISNEHSSSFESKDPALKRADTPVREGDINFIYRDNRAHGVGSLATGEFASAAAAQSATRLESDDQLSHEIKGSLTSEGAGVSAPMKSEVIRNVQVTANNGEVTLTGTVPSAQDKHMIEARAAAMPGVRVVKNELTVHPEADPATRNLERGRDLEDRTSDLQD